MDQQPDAEIRRFFHPSVTDRERAIFEGGIALGTIYHQFVGLPFSKDRKLRTAIEQIIERTIRLQPYRTKLKARISPPANSKKRGRLAYSNLEGKHFDISVNVKYHKATATLRLRYVPELDYPLMYIQNVKQIK